MNETNWLRVQTKTSVRVPNGWEVGFKVVSMERRPRCAMMLTELLPALNTFWFHEQIKTINERKLRKNARELRYIKGRYITARNENTGRQFKSIDELKGYRRRIGLKTEQYGPAIHVFTSLQASQIGILGNSEMIIKVAYNRDEIVHRSLWKVGVFRVKVLT